ncbi:MAG: hypothetical protein GC191_12835 [Azospirillum sp.]|nr:hypothetical protein [Azospirillum sp.]
MPKSPRIARIGGAAVLWVAVACLATGSAAAAKLGSYAIDQGQISVSGISSGGYMAGQVHIAYSASIIGAGIIAGGPYYCAENSATYAQYSCMETWLGDPDVAELVATTRRLATGGEIDDPQNLARARVYLFHGTRDSTVTAPVMAALARYYAAFVPATNIRQVFDLPAEHAMITETQGNPCGFHGSPFINDCDRDVAGEILQQIYGLPQKKAAPDGQLITFDQAEFTDDLTRNSLNRNGHVYVPKACAAGATCRLHVAFHGCKQYEQAIGDQFYTRSGYNEWGEANNIVILYPQAVNTIAPLSLVPWNFQLLLNPNGCWDWWGYTGSRYHTRAGGQMKAVKAMIDRVAAGFAPPGN